MTEAPSVYRQDFSLDSLPEELAGHLFGNGVFAQRPLDLTAFTAVDRYPMKTITLGKTKEIVSEFAIGTMNMGSTVPADVSRRILDCYWEAGGRFIDTANSYTAWAPGGNRR